MVGAVNRVWCLLSLVVVAGLLNACGSAPAGSTPASSGQRTSKLLATADGSAVLYLDRVSTEGTLVAGSMDLLVHAGTISHPVSERFLDRFLPWVVQDLL